MSLSSRGLKASSGTVSGNTTSALFTMQPEKDAFLSTLLNLGTFPPYLILQSTQYICLRKSRSNVFQVLRKG